MNCSGGDTGGLNALALLLLDPPKRHTHAQTIVGASFVKLYQVALLATVPLNHGKLSHSAKVHMLKLQQMTCVIIGFRITPDSIFYWNPPSRLERYW